MNTIPNPIPPQSGAAEPTYRVVCAWCPTVLVEGDAGAPVSHGICSPCAAKFDVHYSEVEAMNEAAESRAEAFNR